MSYRTRIYYTDSDKALMWDRWQAGDSLREIAVVQPITDAEIKQ